MHQCIAFVQPASVLPCTNRPSVYYYPCRKLSEIGYPRDTIVICTAQAARLVIGFFFQQFQTAADHTASQINQTDRADTFTMSNNRSSCFPRLAIFKLVLHRE